ncbi:hypothetical protein ABZ468_51355 [Streptomyces sp. NPDC005708]|uniref:hypothetical protein n=1 Tax=Streptomyces sp. NPDC005708 TaxID=3154564 RepID=UPI0033F5F4C8
MESHRSHHHPGYRCRHSNTSATRPEPGRTPNTYVREDHDLPHLPALHLRLSGHRDRSAELPRAGTGCSPHRPRRSLTCAARRSF